MKDGHHVEKWGEDLKFVQQRKEVLFRQDTEWEKRKKNVCEDERLRGKDMWQSCAQT